MQRYLITKTVPNTRYIAGHILLVSNNEIDQKAYELLQDKLVETDYEQKEKWQLPPYYRGVDPGTERRKWAKYHKAKKAKISN